MVAAHDPAEDVRPADACLHKSDAAAPNRRRPALASLAGLSEAARQFARRRQRRCLQPVLAQASESRRTRTATEPIASVSSDLRSGHHSMSSWRAEANSRGIMSPPGDMYLGSRPTVPSESGRRLNVGWVRSEPTRHPASCVRPSVGRIGRSPLISVSDAPKRPRILATAAPRSPSGAVGLPRRGSLRSPGSRAVPRRDHPAAEARPELEACDGDHAGDDRGRKGQAIVANEPE